MMALEVRMEGFDALARAEIVEVLTGADWFGQHVIIKVPREEAPKWKKWLDSLPFTNYRLDLT